MKKTQQVLVEKTLLAKAKEKFEKENRPLKAKPGMITEMLYRNYVEGE